jgi:rfaE bifunctional protein nucleotidyltransferase chain/domain
MDAGEHRDSDVRLVQIPRQNGTLELDIRNSSEIKRVARDKIHSIEDLGRIAADLRAQNHRIALCHGVFDLVHMGHVRHLEAARREGDILMVTLTADRFVNKGPGRPIFSQEMRAEMIAALEYVDYVAINNAPDAEIVLNTIKPDVYVKGSDYENPDEDITGKISTERDAVEHHGGRLVFTRDITFSSSSLINRYLDVYDPPLRDFLDKLRLDGGPERIPALIESVNGMKATIIGDAIIDEYQYVGTLGKSAKEHIIATLYQSTEAFAGGVFAAANHLAAFCAEVDLITALAHDCPYEDMIRKNLKPNIRLHVIRVGDRPTTRKLRFVDQGGYMRKLFEVYFMDDRPLPVENRARLAELVAHKTRASDLVVVTDFGHGMIGSEVIRAVRNARFLAVNAQTNAGNQGYNLVTKYQGADYICIDAPEARLATADKYSDITKVVGEVLPQLTGCKKAIVTHGSNGAYTFAPDEGVVRIPAFTKTVVDTVGAGDAFFAVTAPLVAAGGRMADVGFVGNAAGAIKVGIVGHRQSVEKIPVVKFATTLLK